MPFTEGVHNEMLIAHFKLDGFGKLMLPLRSNVADCSYAFVPRIIYMVIQGYSDIEPRKIIEEWLIKCKLDAYQSLVK